MNVTYIIGFVRNILNSVRSSDDTKMHNNVFTFLKYKDTKKKSQKYMHMRSKYHNRICRYVQSSTALAALCLNYALVIPSANAVLLWTIQTTYLIHNFKNNTHVSKGC